MPNYYRLPIDLAEAVSPDWKFPKSNQWVSFYLDPSEIFSQSWILKMTDLGLPPTKSWVFYTPPNSSCPPFSHTDNTPNGGSTIAGFNFVIGYDAYDMVWYDLEPLREKQKILYTEAGVPYETFPIDSKFELDRCRIGSTLTLVRTDIPHCVSANTYLVPGRLSISCRVVNEWKSWQECVDHVQSLF